MNLMPQILGSGLLGITTALVIISLRLYGLEKKLAQLIEVLKDSQSKHEQGTQAQ